MATDTRQQQQPQQQQLQQQQPQLPQLANHTMEAISKFDEILRDIGRHNPREHKRLKFVNKNMIDLELIETKLINYLTTNLSAEQLEVLRRNLAGCVGECRVCECLLALIRHAEERIDRHVELFNEIRAVIVRVQSASDADEEMAENVIEKCSLMIYDSFHFLCNVKRMIAEVCAIYQVPYYYDTGSGNATDNNNNNGVIDPPSGAASSSSIGNIRLRSSLLSTYKNLNVIIDDLSTISESLWVVRNYDSLVEG